MEGSGPTRAQGAITPRFKLPCRMKKGRWADRGVHTTVLSLPTDEHHPCGQRCAHPFAVSASDFDLHRVRDSACIKTVNRCLQDVKVKSRKRVGAPLVVIHYFSLQTLETRCLHVR